MLSRLSKRQKYAYLTALLLGAMILLFLIHPDNARLHAHGPMNAGHEKLKCIACHKPAEGTLRQRLQHNVQVALGRQQHALPLGHYPVDNAVCQQCHARPNDRHPVYRFNEPKYIKLRNTLAPQECNSCHSEHSAQRVTKEQDYCRQCHKGLAINNDPITIPHHLLIKEKNWTSCLGCHDYHGNHVRQAQKDLAQAVPENDILKYFKGGASPYSDKKQFKSKRIAEYEN